MESTTVIELWTKLTFVLGITWIAIAKSEPSATVTIPTPSIKETGVLAIHCKIWNLEDYHHVSLSRDLKGVTELLSLNNIIVAENNDNVFLAKRTLADGAVVYFLTITNLKRSESGKYHCKVIRTADNTVIASDTVDADVRYFPSEEHPHCNPGTDEKIVVTAGRPVTLNCTSERGSPPVFIQWSKTGTGVLPKGNVVTQDNIAYSELTLTPTRHDDNTLFLCKITSDAFPELESTCHIGPLIVIGGDNTPYTSTPSPTVNRIPGQSGDDVLSNEIDEPKESQCSQLCEKSSWAKQWMVITYSVGALAVILLLMAIVLLVIYKVAVNRGRNERRVMRTYKMTDDVYSNIAERNHHLYMSLDRNKAMMAQTLNPKLETGFT